MFYWAVLFSLATVVAGVFALFGSELGAVLALVFFALGVVTLLLARRGAPEPGARFLSAATLRSPRPPS